MEEFIFTGDMLCESILFIREDRENNTLREENPNYNIKPRDKENKNYNTKRKGNSLRKVKYSDEFIRKASLGVDSIINRQAVSKRLAYSLYLLSENRKCNELLGYDFFNNYLIKKIKMFEKTICNLKTDLSQFEIKNKSIAFIIYMLTSFHYINNLPSYITKYSEKQYSTLTKYNKDYFLYPRLIDNFLLHTILMVLKLIENKQYSPNLIIMEHNKLMDEYRKLFLSFESSIPYFYLLIKNSKTSRIPEFTAPIEYPENQSEDMFFKIFKQFENLTEKELIDIIEILKSLFSSSCPTDDEWRRLKKELFISKSALYTEQSRIKSECENLSPYIDNIKQNMYDSYIELQSKLCSFNTKELSMYDCENYLTTLLLELTYLKEITYHININCKNWILLIKDIFTLSKNVKFMAKDSKLSPLSYFYKVSNSFEKVLKNSIEYPIHKKIEKILNLIYDLHLTREPTSFIKKFNKIKKLIFDILKSITDIILTLDTFNTYISTFKKTSDLYDSNLIYDDELYKYKDKISINDEVFQYSNDNIYTAFSQINIATPNDAYYDIYPVFTEKFTKLIEEKYSTILDEDFNNRNKLEIIKHYRRLIDCENFISQTKIVTYNKDMIILFNSIKKLKNNFNIINIKFFESKLIFFSI